MRIFRSVVPILLLVVLEAEQQFGPGCTVTLQLVCDDRARDVLQALQQLAKEFLRCLLISGCLNQNIQHVASINCAPKVMEASGDFEEYLIRVDWSPDGGDLLW